MRTANIRELTDHHLAQIAAAARQLGFDRMAVLAVTEPAVEYLTFDAKFIAHALPHDLHYLRRKERYHIESLLPGAKSILLFAYPYRFRQVEQKLKKARYKIARYAWQYDYHDLLKRKLAHLMWEFSLSGRAVTDSAPFAERYWARRAGLGKIGRSGMLIDAELGSYFLIATLVLTDTLKTPPAPQAAEPASDIASLCGECRRCVQACPTGALSGNSQMDVERCISFRTIESRADIASLPAPIRSHNWIFGCDICQQVCPWNKLVFAAEEFNEEHPLANEIANGVLPETRSKLRGSVFHRRGVNKLRQNIAVVGITAFGK